MNPFLTPVKQPFDNTPLGILKNTITGIPAAAVQVAKNVGHGLAQEFAGPIERAQSVVQSVQQHSLQPLKQSVSKQLNEKTTIGTLPSGQKLTIPTVTELLTAGFAGDAGGKFEPKKIASKEVKPQQPPTEINPFLSAQKAGTSGPFDGETFYRGGLQYDSTNIPARGISLSENKSVASSFNKQPHLKGQGTVEEYTLSPKARLATFKDVPDEFVLSDKGRPITFIEEKVVKWAKEQGYDGIDFRDFPGKLAKDEKEIRVFNPDALQPSSPSIPKELEPLASIPKTEETTPTQPLSEIPKIQPETPKSSPQAKDLSLPDILPHQQTAVQRLIDALQEAKPIRKEQEKLYSQERAARVARVAAVQGKTSGERGFYAELGQLKGELPKANYESVRNKFTQQDIDVLFNMVKDSPKLDLFDQITARGALVKMLGAEGGTVPTTGELKLLNNVFPKEMIDALLAQRPFITKFFEGLTNALNIPRSIMSSFDLSAPLRQGVFFVGRKEFYKSFASMFKQFGSEKAFQAMQEEIASRPTFKLMKRSYLALTEMDRFLTDREEAFMSNWAEKIPGVGRIIKASGRAYVGFLNKLRADVFDTLLEQGKNVGVDFKENEKALMDLSKFINSATGRGDLGALNKAATTLNAVFFSPRLMASRLNLLNPVYYARLDPFVRKQAIKSLLSFAGIATTVLTLTKMGGATVGADPTSADFGKSKVGDTRFDILGGFQQYIRLAAQLISGKVTSSTSGKVITLGEGYRPLTRKEILIRFFQGKENPVASFVTDFLQGEDATGNKFGLTTELVNRFVPLIAQDLTDALKTWGPAGALAEIPAIFGVGTQTYGTPSTSATLNPFLK